MPPQFGKPLFPNGNGSGTCNGTVTLNATGAIADIQITEPGYTGTFTPKSSDTSVATVSIFDNILTITAVASGNATVTVTNAASESSTCPVTVQ